MIAFDTQKRSWAIQVLDLQSGSIRQLSEGWHDEARPSWSANGKWIYFHSNRGGMRDIWKRPFMLWWARLNRTSSLREVLALPL
jgi:Tol biopolymer transport system component